MVQKIHPPGVIWVPSSHLMWADQLKKIDSSSVHILRSPCLMKPSFFSGCHPEKIQVEFYPIFQGGKRTHLFKTKNRVQIKGVNICSVIFANIYRF